MNSEESEYIKCGEIFISSEDDYTFLCNYCNELFYEFTEFKTHSLTHLDLITPKSEPKEKQNDKQDSELDILEFSSEMADYSIYNEDEDNNFHKNNSIASNLENLENDIDLQSETNDFGSTNGEDDSIISIDNISDNLENADKEAENSTEELYCLHCKALFKNEFHDVKQCSEIQQKIKEYNGNFLELLKHGILSCKCQRYFKNHIFLYEHHLKENHCFPNKVCLICKFHIFMNSEIDSSKQNINPDNKIVNDKNENKIDDILEGHKHIRTVSRYKCSICNKFFQTNFQKHKHMKMHEENQHFSCYEDCDEKLKYKSFLKLQEKTHLPNNFQCEMCGSNFKTKSNVLRHERIAHTDPKNWPHQCDICGKSFIQSYRLVEHKRIHTGEKPFGCDICSKFFRKQSNLTEHKKLHSEERKYVCRFCGSSFKQIAGYWTHMKRHSVE